jgi:hypothetical protein
MLAGYLAIFHLWMHLDRTSIMLSGLLWAVAFGAAAWQFRSTQFINKMDAQAHAIVVLDVILEAVLIPTHDHYGFYLCAIAFALVLGGYRTYKLRRPPSASEAPA